MDLIEFEGDLDAFAKQVRMDYTKVLKLVAFDLFTRIVQKTPIDTGRARASWNIMIGTPDLNVAPDGQYPEMKKSSGIEKARQALAGLEAQTLTYAIYITNNLPYIVELEKGHSKQAPKGMVVLSIEEVTLKMNLLIKVPE